MATACPAGSERKSDDAATRLAGVDPSAVTIHRRLLGGGFGRRSNPDFVVEAVRLSNHVRRPVKLIWTREDDLQYGMFRPMNLQRLTAGVPLRRSNGARSIPA